ncbi:hypothetical protein LTR91_000669 [Friedmanniomyces endolithicus]|uniref:Uncharacterized protein n=1 Tax=Friedmanniomyces endolithicus TaxID=329885 RepID=A0AAN6R1C0_9PEZI|nr:hypothetical protein LTR75_009821 [Friedmanniomyces endolithicus]KAK0807452.1 hypothetical protein LTR59_003295 [Friedmanniomyces endolithicus]KAK0809260.1 hypothetical protein LTR38_004329 [Friedmanniomyces endolithicus]KAK0842267.1 hypothetical protein LTR03_009412 [Friedmanniomyces endolithicus]KAK0852402.1 hypothetical protein LTS02_012366 [Friedmanniomyces endolithicus]
MRVITAAATTAAYLCAILSSTAVAATVPPTTAANPLVERAGQVVVCDRSFKQGVCGPDTDLTNFVCPKKRSCSEGGAFKCVGFGTCSASRVESTCRVLG